MNITIKKPINEVNEEPIKKVILKHLADNSKQAYTITGLMIEVGKCSKQHLENDEWAIEDGVLYRKIRKALNELLEDKSIIRKITGKQNFYWINK